MDAPRKANKGKNKWHIDESNMEIKRCEIIAGAIVQDGKLGIGKLQNTLSIHTCMISFKIYITSKNVASLSVTCFLSHFLCMSFDKLLWHS